MLVVLVMVEWVVGVFEYHGRGDRHAFDCAVHACLYALDRVAERVTLSMGGGACTACRTAHEELAQRARRQTPEAMGGSHGASPGPRLHAPC